MHNLFDIYIDMALEDEINDHLDSLDEEEETGEDEYEPTGEEGLPDGIPGENMPPYL